MRYRSSVPSLKSSRVSSPPTVRAKPCVRALYPLCRRAFLRGFKAIKSTMSIVAEGEDHRGLVFHANLWFRRTLTVWSAWILWSHGDDHFAPAAGSRSRADLLVGRHSHLQRGKKHPHLGRPIISGPSDSPKTI